MFDKLKDVLTEVHQEIQRRNTLSDIDKARTKASAIDENLMTGEWLHNKPPEAWKYK